MSDLPALPPRRRSAVSAPFWEAAREQRLRLQRCDTCGYVRWPPAATCPECLAQGGTWTDLAPHGTVWSYCVYDHCYDEAFRDAIPYVVALVELDDGPRIISNVLAPPDAVEVGMAVEAAFVPAGEDAALLRFRPIAERSNQ